MRFGFRIGRESEEAMRVTLDRAALLKSLGHVHRVVERRGTVPILANLQIQAKDGQLRLRATDLDLDVLEDIPAEVEEEGDLTAPAHMLHDIVRKLAEGSEVRLIAEQGKKKDAGALQVEAGRARFELQTLPSEEFPQTPEGEFSHSFEVEASVLGDLIRRTQFAISTEETRYYLNGVYLHVVEEDGKDLLRAVATDGHRLAQAQAAAPKKAKGLEGAIVPRKTVGEIQKLLEGAEGSIKVDWSKSRIRIARDGAVLTSTAIEGVFPDYDRVIPKGNDKKLVLDRGDFSRAVDRVSTVSSERSRAVKLSLSENLLVLAASNPEAGAASEELAVEYSGDSLEIGFNFRYLLDIAGELEGEKIEFHLAESGSPALIRDSDESSAIYVLMPMRVV